MVGFEQSACIQEMWLNSVKVVVFRQSDFIRTKWLFSNISSCNRAKVVVIWKSCCIRGKWFIRG